MSVTLSKKTIKKKSDKSNENKAGYLVLNRYYSPQV